MRAALGLAGCALLAACQGQPTDQSAATAATAAATPTPTARPAAVSRADAKAVSCAAGETPIFACTFDDGKRVAVCGTAPGKAEYRFGRDTAEIVLKGGQNAEAMYSGGGENQLAFANGDTRYIVFSRMVRTRFDGEGNEPAISDGIVIERRGAFAAMRLCTGDLLPVDVNAARTFLSAGGNDLFTDETIRADSPGHE